jgi:hypothetical protein
MNKIKIDPTYLSITIIVLAILGLIFISSTSKKESSPALSAETRDSTHLPEKEVSHSSDSASNLPKLGEVVSGTVNRNEIGGTNLHLESLRLGRSSIDPNGNFEVKIEGNQPQLLGVVDGSGNLRAYAIPLLNNQGKITIDARSSAFTVLTPMFNLSDKWKVLGEPIMLERVEKLVCFPTLVKFFKENLPTTSFEEFIENDNYRSRMHACLEEITGRKFEMKKGQDIFESDWWPYDFQELNKSN